MGYITKRYQRKVKQTTLLTSPTVRPAVCGERYRLPGRSNKHWEKCIGNARKTGLLYGIKGVNIINSFFTNWITSICDICLYMIVSCTSYFMFGFYFVIYFSHTTDGLSIKRQGVARRLVICGGRSSYMMSEKRGKSILDIYIRLLEKMFLTSIRGCLGSS